MASGTGTEQTTDPRLPRTTVGAGNILLDQILQNTLGNLGQAQLQPLVDKALTLQKAVTTAGENNAAVLAVG